MSGIMQGVRANTPRPISSVDDSGVERLAVSAVTPTTSNATTTALATSLVIKASAGTLYRLTGVNTNAATRYIQIHNTTSQPADASVPAVVIEVPAGKSFTYDPGIYGRRFATGITVVNSTTVATLTAGAADSWFDAQYV